MISIIIPSKDRLDIIKQCLNNIAVSIQDYDIEVIVVNDSKVLNLKEALSNYSNVQVHDNKKSGVASARNFGASLAKGQWLLFLDDDMLVNKECFQIYTTYTSMQEPFTANIDWVYPPEVLANIKKTAFGRFLIQYGFTTLKGWNNFIEYPNNQMIKADGITSQNLLMRTSDFKTSGGYNETFPMAGFEDYAFSTELKKKGFKMYIDTRAQMYHNEADRQTPEQWYQRKIRGAQTRKVAVELGYKELEIQYSGLKHLFYSFYNVSLAVTNCLLFISTKSKRFDFFSFKCYKFLLGLSIYKGYHSKPQ